MGFGVQKRLLHQLHINFPFWLHGTAILHALLSGEVNDMPFPRRTLAIPKLYCRQIDLHTMMPIIHIPVGAQESEGM